MKKKTLSWMNSNLGGALVPPAQQGTKKKPFIKLLRNKALKSTRPTPPVLDRLLNKQIQKPIEQEIEEQPLEAAPDPYYEKIDDVIEPEVKSEEIIPEEKQGEDPNKLIKELVEGNGNIQDVLKKLGSIDESQLSELKTKLGVEPGETREELLKKVLGLTFLNTVKPSMGTQPTEVDFADVKENIPPVRDPSKPAIDETIGKGRNIYEERKLQPPSPQVASSIEFYRKQLAQNPKLSEDQRKSYGDSLERVFRSMPDKAAQKVLQNVYNIEFHENTDGIREQWIRRFGNKKLKENEVLYGFCTGDGILSLDGESKLVNSIEGQTTKVKDVVGTYAHEMTHALDINDEICDSVEWKSIWREEIYQLTEGKKAKLSPYARENFYEGFAEFGRLVFGSNIKMSIIKKNFPRAYDLFVKNGFIDDEIEQPEDNKLKVPIGGGRI